MIDRERRAADDEALSALLDDALPPEDAERLRRRLSEEPELAARFAALEHANSAVRESYADIVDEPLPQRVLDLLMSKPSSGADDVRTPNVVELAVRKKRDLSRFAALPAALAAGIALAVGLSLGVLLWPRLTGPESPELLMAAGHVEPGTALHDVLETAPSAATRSLGIGLAATPRLTFKTMAGNYCRHVDLASARGTTATLACRQAGAWQLEMLYFDGPSTSGPQGVYRPAAGAPSALDAAIDALIDGAPLDAEAERALLARGWTIGGE